MGRSSMALVRTGIPATILSKMLAPSEHVSILSHPQQQQIVLAKTLSISSLAVVPSCRETDFSGQLLVSVGWVTCSVNNLQARK